MSCCPSGSAPSFTDDYSPVGAKTSVPGVEFYAVGTAAREGKAIVVIPDIWGWDSGRIRRVADMLSASTGSYVVIPKLFEPAFEGGTDGDALPPDFDLGGPRANECWPWLGQFKYEGVVKPKTDALFDHLAEKGIAIIGSIGFCWGGWLQAHLAADHNIKVLVTPHPSVHAICGLVGENMTELVANVTTPWLMMPAGNDPDIYLPGGEVFERLLASNSASKTVAFPDMSHGWSIRGDVSDAKTSRDVSQCYSLMEEYLNEHLK